MTRTINALDADTAARVRAAIAGKPQLQATSRFDHYRGEDMKVVIESPLSAPDAAEFKENFRYLLWRCRAAWLEENNHAIASHMLNPWFMDDYVPAERDAGIANPWVWERGVLHVFFTDRGMSRGMELALERCRHELRPILTMLLREYRPDCWEAFERGEWPPHTAGFELK